MTTITRYPTAFTSTTGFNANWTNPNNAYAEDDTNYATAAPGRNQEYATNWRGFDFSSIPAGSIINSVQVIPNLKVSAAWSQGNFRLSVWADVTVTAALTSGTTGAIGPDLQYSQSTSAWPTTDTDWTVGLTGTLPTLAQLQGTNFGVRVQVAKGNNGTTYTTSLDSVRIVVDYTAPVTEEGDGSLALTATTAATATAGALIVAQEDAEGGTDEAVITTGNSAFTRLYNSPTWEADAAVHGDMGIHCAPSQSVGWTVAALATEKVVALRWTGRPLSVSLTFPFMWIYDGGYKAAVLMNTSGYLVVQNNGTPVYTGSTAIPTATDSRFEWLVDADNARQRAMVWFDPESTGTPDIDSGWVAMSSSYTASAEISVGSNNGAGIGWYVDDVAYGHAWWIGKPQITENAQGSLALTATLTAAGEVPVPYDLIDFEGGSQGTPIGNTDAGFDGGGSGGSYLLTYDNWKAASGNWCMRLEIDPDSGWAWRRQDFAASDVGEAWASFYFRLPASGLTTTGVTIVRAHTSGGANAAQIFLDTGTTLALRDNTTTVGTTWDWSAYAGEWVRMDWHLDPGTSQTQDLYVYAGNTIHSTDTADAVASRSGGFSSQSGIQHMRWGTVNNTGSTYDVRYDRLAASETMAPGPDPTAPIVLGEGTVAEVSSGNGVTATLPSHIEAGDLLVVQFADAADSMGVLTYSTTGWTQLFTPQSVVTDAQIGVFYRVATGDANDTAPSTSCTGSADRHTAIAQRFYCVDQATPIDVAAAYTGAGAPTNSIALTGVTTATDDAMLVSGALVNCAAFSSTLVKPASMGRDQSASTGGGGLQSALAHERVYAAGATGTRTWTLSSSSYTPGGWVGALRKATGGGPITADASLDLTATGSADAEVDRLASGTLALTATLAADAEVVKGSGSSLALTATSTADGYVVTESGATLAATATLTADADVLHDADGALALTATLAADAIVDNYGSSTLDLTSTLTADASVVRSAAGDLALTADLTADGSTLGAIEADGSLDLTATATAAAQVDTSSAADPLALVATLTADGDVIRLADGSLDLTATGTAESAVDRPAAGTLAVTATASATASLGRESPGTLPLVAALLAAGQTLSTAGGQGDLELVATLAADAEVTVGSGASLAVTAGLTADAEVTRAADSSLSVTADLAADALVERPAAADDLALTSTATAAAEVDRLAAAALALTATASADATVEAVGSAIGLLDLTATLTAAAALDVSTAATLNAVTTLTADAEVIRGSAASLDLTAGLSADGQTSSAGEADGTLDLTAGLTAEAVVLKVSTSALGLTATMVAEAEVEYGATSATLTLTATLYAAAEKERARKPQPSVEALVWSLVKDIGGMRVYATFSDRPGPHHWYQRVTVQVDAKAANKKEARDRAWEAMRAVLSAGDVPWQDGVVVGTAVVTGPQWLPDENGAPRYVARYAVTAHPKP